MMQKYLQNSDVQKVHNALNFSWWKQMIPEWGISASRYIAIDQQYLVEKEDPAVPAVSYSKFKHDNPTSHVHYMMIKINMTKCKRAPVNISILIQAIL